MSIFKSKNSIYPSEVTNNVVKVNTLEKRRKQKLEFTELLEKHKKLIFKVANIYYKNSEARKDLAQEIIVNQHLLQSVIT